MKTYWLHLKNMVGREEGATMLEYGLMVALIAVVLASVVALLGAAITQLFEFPPA